MIHILTLSWNGLDKLESLFPTLERVIKHLGIESKWYVRDNGSKDGTKEWLENLSSDCLEIVPLFIDHNRDNFAQGVNSLYDLASPADDDYVLLLNNDIVFGDDSSLSNMMSLMDDPAVGIVGAKLLYNGTNKLQHAGVIFGPRYGNLPFHYRWKEEDDEQSSKNRYFQAVTAACCLIRAKDFVRLDQNYNWAFEDIDFCLRIGKKKKIAYCGQTVIFHEESATLKKNPVNNLFVNQNVRRFKDKWWQVTFTAYYLDHDKYLRRKDYKIIK